MLRNHIKETNNRKGSILVLSLIVIAAITLVSLSYLSRADKDIAIQENLITRLKTQCSAQAGLTHAKGLLQYPWNTTLETEDYWQGDQAIQIDTSDDYFYDITVSRDITDPSSCTYNVATMGYLNETGQNTAKYSLSSVLNFDPAFALIVSGDLSSSVSTKITGDIYTAGYVFANAQITGDIYAHGSVSVASVSGVSNSYVSQSPIELPIFNVLDFQTSYEIGDDIYSVTNILPGSYSDLALTPDSCNPAGVYFCDGDIQLVSNNVINGTLIVNGQIQISGSNNTIISERNFPAMVASSDLVFKSSNSEVDISGLTYIGRGIVFTFGIVSSQLNVAGSLVIASNGIVGDWTNGEISVKLDPMHSAIMITPDSKPTYYWSPVANAFYSQIGRN